MKKIKSFTTIEMIIVLGIISIIMGLTTAYFFSFKSGSALKLSAKEIAAALGQARSLAITTQKNHEVAFNVTTSEYCINELDEDNNFVQKVGIDHKIRNGIIIDRTTFSNDAAIFGITGNLRGAAGSVYIKNSNDKFSTIRTDNTTGRIKIYNYEKT